MAETQTQTPANVTVVEPKKPSFIKSLTIKYPRTTQVVYIVGGTIVVLGSLKVIGNLMNDEVDPDSMTNDELEALIPDSTPDTELVTVA